jgi:hypothetical protein
MSGVAVCPTCGAELPCFGRGLSRAGAEILALTNREESLRRITLHVRELVIAAGPAGISRYEAAERLGLDPTGESHTERLRHASFRSGPPAVEHACAAASRGLRPGRASGRATRRPRRGATS